MYIGTMILYMFFFFVNTYDIIQPDLILHVVEISCAIYSSIIVPVNDR